MCCIAEIAMSIFGIVTLARGKFSLTRGRVITGLYAYLIGIILTLTLPLMLGIGFVVGIAIGINAGAQGRPIAGDEMLKYAWLDMVFVPIILVIVGVIAAMAPKSSATPSNACQQPDGQLPRDIPPMGDNPYASPYMMDPKGPRPPTSD
jgi:hypothetical protein